MLEVAEPRARNGRAPDVFRPGKWTSMRCYDDNDEVDFAIVGTGAGGGTLACKLAEAGFSVVAFDAGPFWRPLDDLPQTSVIRADCSGPMSGSPAGRIRSSSAPTIRAAESAGARSTTR